MTREELRDRMLAEEFQDWFILEQLEPYGEYGAWMRAGIIASTLANVNRGKDTPPFSMFDFMPEVYRPKKTYTPTTMKERWMAIMEAQNAIMARKMGNA